MKGKIYESEIAVCDSSTLRRKRRSRSILDLNRRNIIQGIIYKEILDSPKSIKKMRAKYGL